jgi:methylglutamate dehydrogenase subunit D
VANASVEPWTAHGVWDGVIARGRHGRERGEAGVRVTPRDGLHLATIIGHRHRSAELDLVVSGLLGAGPPKTPRVVFDPDAALIWSGPDQWLLATQSPVIMKQAWSKLAGVAALSDQSNARAVLRLWGPKIRDVLAKGCLIDLHPRAFRPGDAALTSIAHIGVHLWQLDERPTYELAVFRSMATSFWAWFEASAGEFGYEVA